MRVEIDLMPAFETLVREGREASEELDRNLDSSVQDAAEKGLVAFTAEHPYTDRTFNLTASARVEAARAESDNEFVRAMKWGGSAGDAPYAVFVEAMPRYKFTPTAALEAERVLTRDVEFAVDLFAQRLSRG